MSDKTCGCGHPKHSIPCPDTSGDDGEGHVTICGCHRLVGDKLPALPPRPDRTMLLNGSYKDALLALNYMDAQDARIKELESDAILRRSLMSSLIVQRDKQDEHIAELEREIREAYKLLAGPIASGPEWWPTRESWVKRNTEEGQADGPDQH